MRSYPIWNIVKNCQYKSNKSYGNVDTGEVEVVVGSSSSNSHELVSHITTKRKTTFIKRGGIKVDAIVFKFSVDGIILKTMIFEDNNSKAGKLLQTKSALTRMKGL